MKVNLSAVTIIVVLITICSQTSAQQRIQLNPSTERGKIIEQLLAKWPSIQGTNSSFQDSTTVPAAPVLATESTPTSTKNPLENTIPSLGTPTPPVRSTPTNATNVGECLTPVGKTGVCISLYQCNSLLELLQRKPLLEEYKIYLKHSQCGYRNRTVLVCCPDQQVSFRGLAPAPVNSTKLALLPQPGLCGKMISNRLYGGFRTEIDAYSWNVLLEYSKGGNDTGHHCGGVLINERYILTAAHCVTDLPPAWSLINVRLGEWDTATDTDCETTFLDSLDCADSHIDIPIERVIPHRSYVRTDRNRLHDIALIRLASPVVYTDFISPVCLPSGENIHHAFDGQSLDIVGWGVSSEGSWGTLKQRASAPVIPLSDCREKYKSQNIALRDTQFCVEGRQVNDTCRIDSGGPAISFDTSNRGLGSFFVAGIQSFSQPCSENRSPGVYTRVGEYVNWIADNIQP